MDKEVVISIKTVLFTLGLFLVAYVVYKLAPVLAILLVSTLIVISLEPAVGFFTGINFMNRPLSRSAAVLITFAILLIVLITAITVLVPPVLSQAQKLLISLENFQNELQSAENLRFSLVDVFPQLSNFSSNVFSITISVFSNVATIFSILIISLYMSLDWENIKERFLSIFSSNRLRSEVQDTISSIETNVGMWVKGQLFLMIVVGTLSFISLAVLDVSYALALGLIAGVLEIVPIIGPIISAVLASVVGFADSPLKGFVVLSVFAAIQQVENNILVPKVMERVSGFSPLVILVALLIGSRFFGVVGAVLAVPLTMVGVVVVKKALDYPE